MTVYFPKHDIRPLPSISLVSLLPGIVSLDALWYKPSEEFELTANSLGAQIDTHGGLSLRTLSHFTVISQDELTLQVCCELSVSLQLTA